MNMWGIWACGKAALDKLADLTGRGGLSCIALGEDGYGRVIGTCEVDGLDIGAEMVRSGYAWAFVKYSSKYLPEEVTAREAGRGIWRYDSQPPWEYRASRWASALQTAPEGCPIKGNISSSGKIYHAPWSLWYEETRVTEAKGERWFCSEAEAVAAGWRAPRWD